MSILISIVDITSFILNGVGNFVVFVLCLPSLVYNLISAIPEPFHTVLSAFISIIVFLIVVHAAGKVVQSVK